MTSEFKNLNFFKGKTGVGNIFKSFVKKISKLSLKRKNQIFLNETIDEMNYNNVSNEIKEKGN